MNEQLETKVETLRPFTKFLMTIGELPTSYLMSMTYYEQILWFTKYLQETVIPTVNNNAVAVQEIQDFLNNLDLQDEVDNKLDEMAKDGTLADLINQEIFGQINSRLNLLDHKKYILMGDSYAQGYTPDGNVTGWPLLVKSHLGLTDSNCIIKYRGGYGMVDPSHNFKTLLEEIPTDDEVTDIVVCGGYNDIISTFTESDFDNGFHNFKTTANTRFPNAKIHIGFIGWSRTSSSIPYLEQTCRRYYEYATYYGMEFYMNCMYTLHNYFVSYSSDGIHPNQAGQNRLGFAVTNCILNGSCNNVVYGIKTTLTYPDGFGTSGLNLYSNLNNNTITAYINAFSHIRPNNATIVCDGQTFFELGTITTGLMVGTNTYINYMPVKVVIHATGGYDDAEGSLLFRNGKVYIVLFKIDGSGYKTYSNVDDIQFAPCNTSFNALLI